MIYRIELSISNHVNHVLFTPWLSPVITESFITANRFNGLHCK